MNAADTFRKMFHLDPDVAFLNHGSFGACPRQVLETQFAFSRELEQQPVHFLVRRGADLLREAREAVAAHVGTVSRNLVFLPNATTIVNLLLRSLPLEAGDEVLSLDHEYGACDRAWEAESRRRGLRLKKIVLQLPKPSDDAILEQVRGAIGKRTKVLYFSHITSPTALQLPLEALAKLGREQDLFVMVDGAHGPGQLPLKLAETEVDAYAGNGHKWLMGPKGTGFLYLRENHHAWIEALVISWGSTQHPGESRLVQELEWPGTRDLSGYLALPAAIEFRRSVGWDDACRERREELCEWSRKLCSKHGWSELDPGESELQMRPILLPDLNEDLLYEALCHRYAIEVPVHRFRNASILRVSYQPYNQRRELERLESALGELLPGSAVPQELIRANA